MPTRTADAKHDADRNPTDEESEIAERARQELHDSGEDRSAAEHYEDMARRGVEQKGEGKID